MGPEELQRVQCERHAIKIEHLETETTRLARTIDDLREVLHPITVQLGVMAMRLPEDLADAMADLRALRSDMKYVKDSLKTEFVTKAEFTAELDPLKRFMWMLLGITLTSAIAALASHLR